VQVCRWQRLCYVVLRSLWAMVARGVAGRSLAAAAVAVCLLWYGVAGAWMVLGGHRWHQQRQGVSRQNVSRWCGSGWLLQMCLHPSGCSDSSEQGFLCCTPRGVAGTSGTLLGCAVVAPHGAGARARSWVDGHHGASQGWMQGVGRTQ
jgi:hypothetical protein